MLEDINDMLEHHEVKPISKQRHFAVLIPLIKVDDEIHLLYEIRSKKISQPGETSFPGGRVEAGETYKEAAIRETMEELTISRETIQILGEMDYIVNEQVVIRAFVGELKNIKLEDIQFNEEVEKLYTVPLTYFLAHKPIYYSANVKLEHEKDFPFDLIPGGEKYNWKQGKHAVPFYTLNEHTLWGFTASFTDHFIELLKQHKNRTKKKTEN
ncbi:ADP-ribose pyrophosphatase YjhB, NUDIX family [Carnobacterium alterfunditum]|uniref:ADP-ribose pyrophosphatase YjhB, NUDIX family n=1 Tax=Carnobacterium alterfunditum TaxID=28230 RepID=A0A1N6I1X2_9LACT|nr:CoA pyrophosphatase [Carnobacterium alterfunditum]SIO25949.1 ADP-ribose pyrophosphatase YjhB, NUDIX family [Carnobacterium alterfunditum]